MHNDALETRFAQALAEAAAVVNSSLDFEQVLDRILDQVARVVDGDTYNIVLIEGDEGFIVRWRGYEAFGIVAEELAKDSMPISVYPTFQTMIESGEPILVNDVSTSQLWVGSRDRSGRRAYLGCPIRIGSRTEGFINVNSDTPERFSQEDVRRLRAFADHAAIALRNARLFEDKSRLAEDLERRVQARTEELAARTAWSEAILRSTSDGIVVTNTEGDIIQMNPVAAQWLDQTLTPADANVLRQAIRLLTQHAGELPEQLVELPGLDLQLTAAPVCDQDQGTTASAVVVVVHDVSHLRALDRMKSQFISDVSHELRTPIAAIRLYTSLLQTSSSERWETYFSSLDREIDRISRIVEEILQIARIEAGRLELELQPVDLNLVVTTAVSSHATRAKAKNLAITCDTPPEAVRIHVDPHWFNLVVNELLENAVNYTPSGQIHLTVATRAIDGRTWAVLEIQDSGMGIPSDEIPHLFERFFRGEQPRTLQVQGTGLGLAIVKSILDLHGGRIEVQSTPREGSRFTVWVPLATSPIHTHSANEQHCTS